MAFKDWDAWLILIDIEYVNVIDKSPTEKQKSQLFSDLICEKPVRVMSKKLFLISVSF